MTIEERINKIADAWTYDREGYISLGCQLDGLETQIRVELIDKACEWLENTINIAIHVPEVSDGQKVVITKNYVRGEFVKAFREAMEGKKV